MTMRMLALSTLALSLGCEEKPSKITIGGKPKAVEGCTLSFDTLHDTEWLFLRANPDKTETPDHHTRMKFQSEGGALKVKYNVGSISGMYDYNCNKNGEELLCLEEPKVKDWCQALVAGGAQCTPEALRGIDPNLTDEQIAKGSAEAEEVMKKYRDTPDWDKFKFQNNNLGNKLQGILYVKIDPRSCRLRVTDNYATIYNGKKVEDSNPAGTNPFVKNEQGELLWRTCDNAVDLVSLEGAEYPADPGNTQHVGRHTVGKEVHTWLLHEPARVPKEGCTYTFDTWIDGKPAQKGLVPELVDVKGGKELRWHFAHTFAEPTAQVVQVLIAEQDCGGTRSTLVSACNALQVQ
jgi:hypothetical protein